MRGYIFPEGTTARYYFDVYGNNWNRYYTDIMIQTGTHGQNGPGFYNHNATIRYGTMVPIVGEWFDFKIIFNTANGTYDIFVNDVKVNASAIATPYGNVRIDVYTYIHIGVPDVGQCTFYTLLLH